MNSDKDEIQGIGRREFLTRLSAAATGSALALGNSCRAEDPPSADNSSPAPLLPTIRLGDHHITRLIAGCNPILGYSYMGPIMDQHMREYFSPEQTFEFLWRCEREGIGPVNAQSA